MIVYGIKNCSTVRRALKWLQEKKIDFSVYDYATQGCDEKKLTHWVSQVGWETLLNKKSRVWMNLEVEAKEKVVDDKSAIAIMNTHPRVIKRPLLEKDEQVVLLGFDEQEYTKKLA